VTPSFGCSTAAVYAALSPSRSKAAHRQLDLRALGAGPLERARGLLVNELEPAAERACPELAGFRAHLEELAPGAFRLAGSGSSCFGFFATDEDARDVLERLDGAERGRRYGLRGRWVLSAHSRGLERIPSSAH
jgi:4-diphosphocytidyl-2C-methyl-D-erythritol kinase